MQPRGIMEALQRDAAMLKTIWLVTGTCGEYSDRTEWTVRAFLSKERAQEYVARIERVLLAHGATKAHDAWALPQEWRYVYSHPAYAAIRALDPDFESDYTGTTYEVHSVDLDETP